VAESSSLGESDWEDEDLLTLDEAGRRLRVELAGELAALDGLDGSGPAAHRARVRVAAIRSRLRYIDDGLARGVGTVRRIPPPS
jgi:hypothetical protein